MFSNDEKISFTVQHILMLFVQADYVSLEKLTSGVRLVAKEMEVAIKDYGEEIVMPPCEAFENLDVIKIENSVPCSWSVRFDFWTKESTPSDLSLELTLIDKKNNNLLDVEIDNILVL